MSKACSTCRPQHADGQGEACDHWCHGAGAEDWDDGRVADRCECGCGVEVGIARRSDSRSGQVKGQPLRHVRGHRRSRRSPVPPAVSAAERMLARSVQAESGCRRWTGAVNSKGYGLIKVGGILRLAHRVAYEVWIGPIPDGYEIDHVHAMGCRYRDCLEPSHLEAVTHAENVTRAQRPAKAVAADA